MTTRLEFKIYTSHCDFCGASPPCSNYIVYERTLTPEVLRWCGKCKADQKAEYIGRTFARDF